VWTAPSSGTGTAVITVTVSDGRGGETSEQQIIVYGGSVGGTSLKIVVKDDPVSNQPVSGVYAVLHASDNKTVEETLTTGTDGVADFGNIGRSTASFSIAFEKTTGVQNEQSTQRQIETFVDVKVGDIVYYTDPNNEDEHHFVCDTPTATVDVTLQNVPQTVSYGVISPISQYYYAQGNSTITDAPICPGHIQTDGKLSLLATGSTSENVANSYTFLTDQTVTDGAVYTLPGPNDTSGWRTPLVSTWNVDPITQEIISIYVTGQRKGVWYEQIGNWYDYSNGASSGTIPLINEFPVDSYWVMASSDESANGTILWTRKKYDQLPTLLIIPMGNYSIDPLNYDEASETLSWSVSGSSEKDAYTIELTAETGTWPNSAQTMWIVVLSPTATSWTAFDLPTPLDGWISADTISYGSFNVVDFDIVTGFDETWALFIQGSDPESESERMYSASRSLEFTGTVQRSAARRSSETQNQPKSIKKHLRPLSGLIRR